MSATQRRINGALLSIVLEGFGSRLSSGLIAFALPLYARSLGLSLAQIGVLLSLSATVALILKPAMGWVADRIGFKRGLAVAVGLRGVVSVLYAIAGVPWQLFAVRAVHGVPKSLRAPSSSALIAEHGGKKSIASAFAWYQTAKTSAAAIGKAAAGVVLGLTASNFAWVFVIAAVLSTLPLLVVVRLVPKDGRRTVEAPQDSSAAAGDEADAAPTREAPAARRAPSVLPFVGLGFLIDVTAHMIRGFFPILATEYAGLSTAQTGLVYLISPVVVVICGPLFGWLSDHVSRKLVLMVRSVANILSSILYMTLPNFFGVATARVLDQTGKAAFQPAWGSLMAQVSGFDRSRRGRTMSVMSMGEDAGTITGPILAGFLWNSWGIVALFGVRIALAVVAEVYALIVNRSLDRRPSDAAARSEPSTAAVGPPVPPAHA